MNTTAVGLCCPALPGVHYQRSVLNQRTGGVSCQFLKSCLASAVQPLFDEYVKEKSAKGLPAAEALAWCRARIKELQP